MGCVVLRWDPLCVVLPCLSTSHIGHRYRLGERFKRFAEARLSRAFGGKASVKQRRQAQAKAKAKGTTARVATKRSRPAAAAHPPTQHPPPQPQPQANAAAATAAATAAAVTPYTLQQMLSHVVKQLAAADPAHGGWLQAQEELQALPVTQRGPRIAEKMSLGAVRRKLNAGAYRNFSEFSSDVKRLWRLTIDRGRQRPEFKRSNDYLRARGLKKAAERAWVQISKEQEERKAKAKAKAKAAASVNAPVGAPATSGAGTGAGAGAGVGAGAAPNHVRSPPRKRARVAPASAEAAGAANHNKRKPMPLRTRIDHVLQVAYKVNAEYAPNDGTAVGWFGAPVSLAEEGYYDVIKQPMDLRTLHSHVNAGKYKRFSMFKKDLALIWTNAIKYNGRQNLIGKAALAMKKACLAAITATAPPTRVAGAAASAASGAAGATGAAAVGVATTAVGASPGARRSRGGPALLVAAAPAPVRLTHEDINNILQVLINIDGTMGWVFFFRPFYGTAVADPVWLKDVEEKLDNHRCVSRCVVV